ncbi:MAG: acetoacetate decarboxylase family protein [Deltaproteobacteria bacterium]|nr:acetoacetate decarboxylase family protein [Deltaproteobacteria bacterium]
MEKRQRDMMTFKQEWADVSVLAAKNSNMWDGARIVLCDVPIDKRQVKAILPLFMTPTKEAKATLFIANYVKNSFSVPYHEAALLLHVRTPLGRGVHCPWMIVDDDSAMIYGREHLGYPKKMGEFIFEETKTHIHASVKRRGVEILSMDGAMGKSETNPAPVLGMKTFNVRSPGQFFIFHPIWLFRAKETVTESYETPIKLTLNESVVDPIARLIDGNPFNGRMTVIDIIGGAYMLPVGLASFRWFVINHKLRHQ